VVGMIHKIENEILVECDECTQFIKRNVEDKNDFEIPEIADNLDENRRYLLEYIVRTLYHQNDYYHYPKASKEKY
jgi:hypothetical protein